MASTKIRGITIEFGANTQGVVNGLRDINKAVNTTSTELRDIDKLLKLDPTNTELLAQKQEVLQRQVGNTEEKIKALKEAQNQLNAEMKDGGTEQQQKQMAALEREIIATEQQQNKYKEQLQDTNSETKELAKSQEGVKDSTAKMQEGFTVLKGVLANLVTDGLRKAKDAMKDLLESAPAYADDIMAMSTVTSIGTDALQEYKYMAGLVDVEVETITGSVKKLTKNMLSAQKGTGDAAKSFENLGISVVNSNGNLRDARDIFAETIDALGSLENETERDAMAMTIFGKSAMDLNPLIEAGSDKIKAFSKEARDMGYVLDNDSLEALGRVQDAYDRWDKQLEGIKNNVAIGFAPAIEKAMKKASTALNNIDWRKVGKDVGNVMDKLIDGFEWVTKNGPLVKSVLSGIVAAFAANKISSAVSALGGMVNALKTATTAQEGLNMAANANPYVLLATAFIALGTAVVTYAKAANEAAYENSELGKRTAELIEENDKLIASSQSVAESYISMSESRQASIDSGEAEIEHARNLAAELETIVDANGRVKEGYEARADFILGELNNALGTEYKQIDGIVQGYDSLVSSLDQVLEKKRAELIMQAQEAAYKEAIVGRTNAEKELLATYQQKVAAEQQLAQQEQRRSELAKNLLLLSEEERTELANLTNSNKELKANIEELNVAYESNKETLNKYYYDIQQYESNYVAAHEGNFDAIDTTTYETMQSAGGYVEDYSQKLIDETEKQNETWRKSLAQQISDATGHKIEFKQAGNGLIQAYIDGQKAGHPVAETEIRKFGDTLANDLANKKGNFINAGHSIGDGVKAGIDGNQSGSLLSIGAFANSLLERFKNVLGIHSPSTEAEDAMRFYADGSIVGIEKNKGRVLKKVDEYGKDINEEMKKSLNQAQKTELNMNTAFNGGITSNGMLGSMYSLMKSYMPYMQNQNLKVVLDSGVLVGEIAPKMSNKFGEMSTMNRRGI